MCLNTSFICRILHSLFICLQFVWCLFILQVLTDPDHCYCVLLNADGGAAFPSERTTHDSSSSDVSSLKSDTGSGNTKKTKVWYMHQFASYCSNFSSQLHTVFGISILPVCMGISGVGFVCITFHILPKVEPITFLLHFYFFCCCIF